MMTAAFASNPLRIEHGLLAGAVATQRAVFADRVGALEDPVLPSGEPRKDLRLHRLRPAEAEVRFQASQTVGREARALLEEDADLVLPVDVIEREGDETKLRRALGIERLADDLARGCKRLRLTEEPRLEPRQTVTHRPAR